MPIKLSICIPTYNRARYLPELLDSIIDQATEDVEIVVSDNASTDGTEALIGLYLEKFPRIRYQRWPENMGADQNYLNVVELAAGKYCWLMGSDDTLKEGAIDCVLKELAEGKDIYLCARTEADISLKPIADTQFISIDGRSSAYDLSSPSDMARYLDSAIGIAALFSYLSSIVLLREKWNRVETDRSFIGSAYVHVQKLLSFIPLGCMLKYIEKPMVVTRLGNDSFTGRSMAKRALLDIDGYMRLADRFFQEDPVLKGKFIDVLRRSCERDHTGSITRVFFMKVYSDPSDWSDLVIALRKISASNRKVEVVNAIPFLHVLGEVSRKLKQVVTR